MADLFAAVRGGRAESRSRRRRAAAAARLSVAELTNAIRDLLETGFGDIWVEGEISNCSLWNTGHMYFTLKDGGAQIKAVMFRSAVRYLKLQAGGRPPRRRPRPARRLRAEGRVSDRLRAPGAARARRAAARLRAAEAEAAGRGAVRCGAQAAAARAAPPHRHRHVARRRGDARHPQGAAAAGAERELGDPAGAGAGRRRRRGCRDGAPDDRESAGG